MSETPGVGFTPEPEASRGAYSNRGVSHAQLVEEMLSLRQSMQHASASSPLTRQLVADLSEGTYRRLAPLVQAADDAFIPDRESKPRSVPDGAREGPAGEAALPSTTDVSGFEENLEKSRWYQIRKWRAGFGGRAGSP